MNLNQVKTEVFVESRKIREVLTKHGEDERAKTSKC